MRLRLSIASLAAATAFVAKAMLTTTAAQAQVSVLTLHNDVGRTGQNLSETILTPASAGSTRPGEVQSNYATPQTILPHDNSMNSGDIMGNIIGLFKSNIIGLFKKCALASMIVAVTPSFLLAQTNTNIALNKPATASSVESNSTLPSYAFDGSLSTRWSSQFSDPQWIYIDLGSAYNINEVILTWETAYGKAYQIQVSNDATNWTSIYSTTTGTGGVNDLAGLSGTGRYVRMYGTQRGTQWGYSLWEFAVYGTLASGGPTASLSANPTSITAGQSSTLTWSSTNATSCTSTSFSTGGATAGSITVTPSSTTSYSVSCTGSSGTATASATVVVSSGLPNIALNKPATASSVESNSTLPSYAFDGSLSTRWSSQFSDPQWIYVDLGSAYNINEVKLTWESAYGKAYQIQVSNDATNWTSIYSTTTGTGGVNDLAGLSGTGRYVRMYGTQRGTQWGYSLWEFAVYGTPAAGGPTASLSANPTSITAGQSSTLTWSSTNATSCTGTGFSTGGATAGSITVTPSSTTTYSVSCTGSSSTATASATVVVSSGLANIALNKPATASSVESNSYLPSYAFDGSLSTRWSSQFSDPQWIYVDLGSAYNINEVKLTWESAYGKAYQIQVSGDAANWTSIYSTTTGTGGVNDLAGLSGTGRYVRMYGTQRGTQYGYSLWEFAVYGTPAPTPTASLSANPTSITAGQSSTLTWSSTNVTSCSGTGFSTGGATTGSRTVTPSSSTTYSVICTGSGGTATASVIVHVGAGLAAVTTYHYDNLRTGWNNQETTLTATSFPSTFGILSTVTLDDQVDAQPLVVPAQTINGSTHDVVYVATANNTVYAIDASTGAILLSTNLGAPVSATVSGCNNNGPNIGITSTPVIDLTSQTLYVIAYVNLSGVPVYRLHALSLSTLADKAGSPVTVSASHTLTDGSTLTFNARYQRQRPALLELNGNVYAGFGSFCDFNFDQSRGWLLGWNASTLAPLAANQLNDTQAVEIGINPPFFFLSSIWMSGFGIASDGTDLYFATGNSDCRSVTQCPSGFQSTWDGKTNIQESVVRLSGDLTQILRHFHADHVAEHIYTGSIR